MISFGVVALDFYKDIYSNMPDAKTLWSASSPIKFQGKANWTFIFIDYNSDALNDPSNLAPPAIFTNRTAISTYSCNSWPVIVGGNGTSTNLTVMLDSSGEDMHVTIPYIGGSNQTTFITNPKSDCGRGCSIVNAFEASDTKPWWYECNITVSDVQNATLLEHQVGQDVLKMAASAIALQGHALLPNQSDTAGKQYQYYPSSSYYGTPFMGSTDNMGMTISEFAIGVIAAAAQYNPYIDVSGDTPDTGNQLDVKWMLVTLILALTAGVQFLLFVTASFIVNMVTVKDNSPLSTAHLLWPIVERLGPAGTYATSEQVCKMLQEKGQEKLVYSV
jgi:hypothetical protein